MKERKRKDEQEEVDEDKMEEKSMPISIEKEETKEMSIVRAPNPV